MSPLRVLIVSHLWPRADFLHLGIFVADQAAELAKRCQLSVVAPVDLTRRSEELGLRELMSGSPQYRARTQPRFLPVGGLTPAPMFFRASYFRQMFAGQTALRLAGALEQLKADSFDLIHAHTIFPDGLACAAWLKAKKTKFIVTAHGSDVHSMPMSIQKELPPLLQRADVLITVSRSLAERLSALGADEAKLRILPNGFSAELFNGIGLEKRDPRSIVFLGRLGAIKRVDLLIRAMAYCANDIRLEIAGDGAERSKLEALVHELDLQERVKFLGTIPREQLPQILSRAALMCIVSEREGWPTVIFEALACGTPILATAVGGIPEALEKAALGRLVPPTISPHDLAREIEKAIASSWDHAAIRRHALQFSWDAIGGRLFELYQQVASQQTPGMAQTST